MTNQEALDILINAKICRNSNHEKQVNEAIEILQELIDKATPTKPIWSDDLDPMCPYWHCMLDGYEEHCEICDQRIDWSEDERNQKFEEQ